jgi:DNA-binding transcriptional LysR family regulator
MRYGEKIDMLGHISEQGETIPARTEGEIGVGIKTEDLRAFAAVVRHRSVSRAAEALRLTQSAITRRIQSLESSLGVELLNRINKPLRPSQLGQLVFEQCRTILEQVAQLHAMVASEGTPLGTFRFGAPQFIGETALTETLKRLNVAFPNLRVEVTTGLSPTLLESVESGELDAAAVVLPQRSILPETVAGRTLADLEMVIVAAKGEYKRRAYALKDIYERGWVLNPRECGFRNGLEMALNAKGVPLKLNIDVYGAEVQLGLVAQRVGLGLVPTRQLETSRHRRRLQRIEVSDFKLRNSVWIVHPKVQGCLSAATDELAGVIKQLYAS